MKRFKDSNVCFHLFKNVLWVNGSKKYYLNQSSTYYVDKILSKLGDGKMDLAAVDSIIQESEIDRDILRGYVVFVMEKIFDAVNADQLNSLLLDPKATDKFSYFPTRMDLAVTYDCNNKCKMCYAACPRKGADLDTNQWRGIISKLRDIGIPSLNFTGGEPTLRDDLAELMEFADDFAIGLTTNGRLLTKELCQRLKKAGLNYNQITLHSFKDVHNDMAGDESAWDETTKGIKESINAGINTLTNTTLLRENSNDIVEFISFVHELGVKQMCFNSLIVSGYGSRHNNKDERLSADELREVLVTINETAKLYGIKVIWLYPTCYKKLNPLEVNLGIKACSACHYNMSIEPDGRVIPCQSWIHEGCGNILSDSWDAIWNSTLVSKIKEGFIKGECIGCRFENTCGGGCPIEKYS